MSSTGRPIGASPPVMNASRRPFRRDREVGHRGEAAEALAEDAPALAPPAPAGSAPRRGRSSRRGSASGDSACSCGGGTGDRRSRPASTARCRAGRAAGRGSHRALASSSPRAGWSAGPLRTQARPGGRQGTAVASPSGGGDLAGEDRHASARRAVHDRAERCAHVPSGSRREHGRSRPSPNDSRHRSPSSPGRVAESARVYPIVRCR